MLTVPGSDYYGKKPKQQELKAAGHVMFILEERNGYMHAAVGFLKLYFLGNRATRVVLSCFN